MVFQCINIRQVPSAFGLGFQHLPRDLANANAWKTMFDPYIEVGSILSALIAICGLVSSRFHGFTRPFWKCKGEQILSF